MSVIIHDAFSLPETRLFDSKWVKIETGRGISTLTLPNLYKDDEGLYTLRMVTKGGTAQHSAFVSVSGEAGRLPGRLAAPRSAVCGVDASFPLQTVPLQSPTHPELRWT